MTMESSNIHSLDFWVEAVQAIQGALLDAWVILDAEGKMLAFNRAFFSLFPRRIARNLNGEPLARHLVLELPGREGRFDPVAECRDRAGAIRFDEVEGSIEGGRALNLIVSASPLGLQALQGVLVVLRDVTDEAQVQGKYKQMLQDEADAKAQLEDVLRQRTQELMQANDRLNVMQAELMQFRKGLLLS